MKKQNKKIVESNLITTTENPEDDFGVLYLAACGFSQKLIARETGLSISQIKYRLGLSGVKIKDYRDGFTPLAGKIITQGRYIVTQQLAKQLTAMTKASESVSQRSANLLKFIKSSPRIVWSK